MSIHSSGIRPNSSGFESIFPSTGSTMSHQPPGGELIASMGAGTYSSVSSKPPSSRPNINTTSAISKSPHLTWLSTSSRPAGRGLNVMYPHGTRIGTPPQPPPLPPPPPSPQLQPLKARLARSQSAVASRPLHSTASNEENIHGRWIDATAGDRQKAYRLNPNKSCREADKSETTVDILQTEEFPRSFEDVPYSIPGTFLPIDHPRERNALTVCLANLVFLSISVVVTSVFSTIILPFCLIALLIRRIGVYLANAFHVAPCCRCNKPHFRLTTSNALILYIRRRFLMTEFDADQICQCLTNNDNTIFDTLKPLRPLTPAELKWLPPIEIRNSYTDGSTDSLISNNVGCPFVIICLRFGSPGMQLTRLRDIIANRLLNRCSTPSSLVSSPRGSSHSEKWFGDRRHSHNTFGLPPDAFSRLTQCLACLSTGYAWRECPAFCLEEHVLRMPVPTRSKKSKLKHSSSISPINRNSSVEALVEFLCKLPMASNRPLWNAYLLEKYHETNYEEASDADSNAETDDFKESDGRWSKNTLEVRNQPLSSTSSNKTSLDPDKISTTSSGSASLVCRHSGTMGVGSLLIFRLHASLSDDGRALVHLLTNCLTDIHSHYPSARSTPTAEFLMDETKVPQPFRQRWRGHHDAMKQKSTTTFGTQGEVGDRSVVEKTSRSPAVPARSYLKFTRSSNDPTSQTLQHNPQVTNSTNPASVSIKVEDLSQKPTFADLHVPPSPEDDDVEESEAAQWWYSFWSSSLATMATFYDIIRALLTGPAVILHKYLFTRADMGLLNKLPIPSHKPTSDAASVRTVYKCTLLSLVKLSRVRQVTKSSYSELILSLLAGGLRAYHQSVGIKHPPDLLAFLSVEVPVLPHLSRRLDCTPPNHLPEGCQSAPCTQFCSNFDHARSRDHSTNAPKQTHRSDHLVETGLIGTQNRKVALSSPQHSQSLCPGCHVLADICLPINTEGMLPRLWEIRQRLIELNNSVDPLCLSWARTVLYTLLPHPVAAWVESQYGSTAKASVSVTGLEVVSPFTNQLASSKDISQASYQMPPTRRLAYMSLLVNKSAEARGFHRRLRKRRRRTLLCPPQLGTSFRALARHLKNANAGLIYISGSPVVRIDTWMPSPQSASQSIPYQMLDCSTVDGTDTTWFICRDLSVTFTTYAGQLSLTLSANAALDNTPNLDLILQAMKMQLRKLCCHLAGRHISTPTDHWLSQSSDLLHQSSASEAVNLSPSLNPNVVLHSSSSTSTGANKELNQAAGPKASPTSNSPTSLRLKRSAYSTSSVPLLSRSGNVSDAPEHASLKMSIIKQQHPSFNDKSELQTIACFSGNLDQMTWTTEQLQDRFRWVQFQLLDQSPSSSRVSEQQLTKLRSEFGNLLRELEQRCSSGNLNVRPELQHIVPSSSPNVSSSPIGCASSTVLHIDDSIVHAVRGTFDRVRRCSTERILPVMKMAHGKKNIRTIPDSVAYNGENYSPSWSNQNLPGGDFDEHPDFYLDGYAEDDDDEFADDTSSDDRGNQCVMMNEQNQPTSSKSEYSSRGCAMNKPKHTLKKILSEGWAGDTNARRRKGSGYHEHHKLRRKSINSRRFVLSTNLSSLDITPGRRGSLGTIAGNDGVFSKLMKPRLAKRISVKRSGSDGE